MKGADMSIYGLMNNFVAFILWAWYDVVDCINSAFLNLFYPGGTLEKNF
jgi:hypothetical protein